MNTAKIEELANKAGITFKQMIIEGDEYDYYHVECNDNMAEDEAGCIRNFAELIVRECINQAHSVGDLRGVNDDMVYGADTAALKISKYFGVEE
jgi:hypothetical protein